MKRRALWTLLAFLALGLWISPNDSVAQEKFPTKPIRIIVAFTPGGGEDTEVRAIAPSVQKYLGTGVLIENIPGANGVIGYNKAYQAMPDGYTLLCFGIPAPIIQEAISPSSRFQCVRFTHIAAWSQANNALFVNVETWKTFQDFLAAAKTKTLSAGITARGSASHFSMLLFLKSLNLKVNAVPFFGGAESITSLAGKHVDFVVVGTTTAYSLVKAGKLRPLVVLSNTKDVTYPDVPTLKDLNLNVPTSSFIRGVVGSPGIPKDRVRLLEQAFLKAARDPEFIERAKNVRLDIVPLSSEEYLKATKELSREVEKVKDLFRE